MTPPGLTATLATCDSYGMALLICDGAVYTAGELEFLVRIGWLPVETLLKCAVSWLT